MDTIRMMRLASDLEILALELREGLDLTIPEHIPIDDPIRGIVDKIDTMFTNTGQTIAILNIFIEIVKTMREKAPELEEN